MSPDLTDQSENKEKRSEQGEVQWLDRGIFKIGLFRWGGLVLPLFTNDNGFKRMTKLSNLTVMEAKIADTDQLIMVGKLCRAGFDPALAVHAVFNKKMDAQALDGYEENINRPRILTCSGSISRAGASMMAALLVYTNSDHMILAEGDQKSPVNAKVYLESLNDQVPSYDIGKMAQVMLKKAVSAGTGSANGQDRTPEEIAFGLLDELWELSINPQNKEKLIIVDLPGIDRKGLISPHIVHWLKLAFNSIDFIRDTGEADRGELAVDTDLLSKYFRNFSDLVEHNILDNQLQSWNQVFEEAVEIVIESG